uniref:HEAT repeat-containing protein 1 n=1 Tax=Clastoptera arizonana TaxID=38151 RepID=A0A1B6CC16_9HEMI
MDDKDKELIFLSESLESDRHALFWSQVKEFISISYLPELKFAEERFLVPEDFVEHKLLINRNLKTLSLVTKNLIKKFTDNVNVDDEIIQLLILLCGENMDDELWTTKEIVKTTENLLDDFLKFINISNLKKLLFEYKVNFAFTLLTKLRPKLLKDSWKRFPAAISCYKFLLFHIESPHLSENIDSVLPTALIVLDDHVVSNRVIAIKCIEHIINNSTSTDLTLLGRGNLLYKTMEPLIHFRDPEVFPALISCIIALLTKTEHPEELKFSYSGHILTMSSIFGYQE